MTPKDLIVAVLIALVFALAVTIVAWYFKVYGVIFIVVAVITFFAMLAFFDDFPEMRLR